MTIRDVTYKLCKKIQKSPNRDSIKNLILALSLNNDTIIFRQTVRHISKYPKLQFLAYLIVDEQTKKSPSETKQQTRLDEEEVRLLANCHEQILKLNDSCISSILEKIPNVDLAISPFNIAVKNKLYTKKDCDEDFELFDADIVNDLVSAFGQHPAIKIAFETFENLDEEITKDHYFDDVVSFAQEIVEASPFESPQWLSDSKIVSKNNHLKHMLALVSIRDTLSNINQLIFQATAEIDDKLLIFDEENTIDLSSWYSTEVSHSIRVTCLTSDLKFLLAVEPLIFNSGTLVLVKNIHGYEGIELGRVEGRSNNLFSDYGDFDIRFIDENLNSFPYILKENS